MQFSTTNPDALTAIFGMLRKMTDLGPFYFHTNGIELCTCFDKYTGAVVWEMDANRMTVGTYHCERNEYLMLDNAKLSELLASCKNWESFTLTRTQNTDTVHVALQDKEKRSRLSLIPLQNRGQADDQLINTARQIQSLVYTDRVVILSRLFKQAVTFTKKSPNKTLTLKYNAARKYLFLGSSDVGGDIYEPGPKVTFYTGSDPPVDNTVVHHYSVNVLTSIIRISKVSEYVSLNIAADQNLPLKLEYDMASLGRITFFALPRADPEKKI
jgi:hypothetical protein